MLPWKKALSDLKSETVRHEMKEGELECSDIRKNGGIVSWEAFVVGATANDFFLFCKINR